MRVAGLCGWPWRQRPAAGREEESEGSEESGSEDEDADSDGDGAWGPFGIWTSLGFDRRRGDMVVCDSGTRDSEASVWIS